MVEGVEGSIATDTTKASVKPVAAQLAAPSVLLKRPFVLVAA
jgi:hypothetical protein